MTTKLSMAPAEAPYFPVESAFQLKPKNDALSLLFATGTCPDGPCDTPVEVGLFFDGTNNNLDRDLTGQRVAAVGVVETHGGRLGRLYLRQERHAQQQDQAAKRGEEQRTHVDQRRNHAVIEQDQYGQDQQDARRDGKAQAGHHFLFHPVCNTLDSSFLVARLAKQSSNLLV